MTYRVYDDLFDDPHLDWSDLHEPFFEWRPPFARVSAHDFPERWCVIGGGVAGLTAAYELDRFASSTGAAVSVDLLECSDNLGGRIHTHHFTGASFAELGPMRIPHDHKVARRYVEDEFNLTCDTFSGETNYFYKNRFFSDWRTILSSGVASGDAGLNSLMRSYLHRNRLGADLPPPLDPESLLIAAMNALDETAIADGLFAARHAGLSSTPWSRVLDLYRCRPVTAWGLGLDAVTVREAFDIAVHRWIKPTLISPATKRDFAQHLWDEVATLQGLNWLEHISCLHFLREAQALGAASKTQVVRGFGSITEEFENRLTASRFVTIEKQTRVRAIRLVQGRVQVEIEGPPASGLFARLARGASSSPPTFREYDRVICAIPTSAVRRIVFNPDLEPEQKAALNGISYLSASKSAVLFKSRWWELGKYVDPAFGRKFGGVTYTDLPNQQVWYPNDNLRPAIEADEFSAVANDMVEPPRSYESLDNRPISPAGVGPADPARSHSEGALLAAYMWGQNADRFTSMSDSDREEEIRGCLEAMAPGCWAEIDDIVHLPWILERNPGGGAFAWYEPAQQTRYQGVAGQPLWPIAKGGPFQVTFAGEHLGLIQGWLQGAMQSALAALRDATRR